MKLRTRPWERLKGLLFVETNKNEQSVMLEDFQQNYGYTLEQTTASNKHRTEQQHIIPPLKRILTPKDDVEGLFHTTVYYEYSTNSNLQTFESLLLEYKYYEYNTNTSSTIVLVLGTQFIALVIPVILNSRSAVSLSEILPHLPASCEFRHP